MRAALSTDVGWNPRWRPSVSRDSQSSGTVRRGEAVATGFIRARA